MMTATFQITLRSRRDDVATIIGMLADHHLGGARERLEHPLSSLYYDAFERLRSEANIQLMVAGEGDRTVGCLQLHPAGIELAWRFAAG